MPNLMKLRVYISYFYLIIIKKYYPYLNNNLDNKL